MHESLVVLMAALRERVHQARENPEAGAVSMEQVVITAGLLALAILVAATIFGAVTGRLGAIF